MLTLGSCELSFICSSRIEYGFSGTLCEGFHAGYDFAPPLSGLDDHGCCRSRRCEDSKFFAIPCRAPDRISRRIHLRRRLPEQRTARTPVPANPNRVNGVERIQPSET